MFHIWEYPHHNRNKGGTTSGRVGRVVAGGSVRGGTMLSMTTSGIKSAIKALEQDKKQMRFAGALALTRTAKRAAEVEKRMAKNQLDKPTPFTLRGFRFDKATKTTLQARVYIMPIQSQYLAWQVAGGRRKGRSSSGEALPVNVAVNKYGNIVGRGKGKIQKLINRPDTFVGTVRGIRGLWQRLYENKGGRFTGAGRSRKRNVESSGLRLLVRFVPSVQYQPRFEFYDVAERVFHAHFGKEFDKALSYARRTAR
jgi:hypothetical protein